MAKSKLGMVLVIVWELDEDGERLKCALGPEWVEARSREDVMVRMARMVDYLSPENMAIEMMWPFEKY